MATKEGAHAHCSLGRVVSVLAAASSGVGERQGGVKCIKTMIVARFGNTRRAGKRVRAKQERWWRTERVDTKAGTMHTHGQCVNFAIKPRHAFNSCLACSPSWFGSLHVFELVIGELCEWVSS